MIEQIRPAGLAQWVAAQDSALPAVVLDVREPWERYTASIEPEGFEVVTMPMNEIPTRLAELDPGQPIACLCHHGTRSQHVAAFLAQNGFERLANIAGGIEAWSVERDPRVPRY